MDIALKNIKLNLSQSLSSHCFTATLFIDGKACFDVKDDGFAEPILYYPLLDSHIQLSELLRYMSGQKIACADAASQFASHSQQELSFTELDAASISMVDEHVARQKTEQQLRRVTFLQARQLYQLSNVSSVDELTLARVKKQAWWRSDNVLLNELPLKRAQKLLQALNFRIAIFEPPSRQL